MLNRGTGYRPSATLTGWRDRAISLRAVWGIILVFGVAGNLGVGWGYKRGVSGLMAYIRPSCAFNLSSLMIILSTISDQTAV